MPITIEEVTADVTPPDGATPQPQRSSPQPSEESERRRMREHLERLQQRAARAVAD